ncbi:uncharacterized protein LAJ45_00961 [Morchella importuna]|uniref:uncharacterized protein n=1 Tax=Morchella importuna TaxID=1174673 RepID=UPI001E8D122D|nr:uncharacterized protein LAJ45_00961 [Morchella importuna]KAH8154434.1 hypothetical protein LAJ45_00961 [Morchella importuna]
MDDHKEGQPVPGQEGGDTGKSQPSRSISMSSDSTLSSVSYHSSLSCAFPLRTVEQREIAVNATVGNTGVESTEQTGNDALKHLVLNESGLPTTPSPNQSLLPTVGGRFRRPSLSENKILQQSVHRDNQSHSASPIIGNITRGRNTRVVKFKNSRETSRTFPAPPVHQKTMTKEADSRDALSAPETIRYRENLRRYEEDQRREEIINPGPPMGAGDHHSLPQIPPLQLRARQLDDRLPLSNLRRQGGGQREAEAPEYRPMVDGGRRSPNPFGSTAEEFQNALIMRTQGLHSYPHDHNLRASSRYPQVGIGNSNAASGQRDFTTPNLIGDNQLNGTRRSCGPQVSIEEPQPSQRQLDELRRGMDPALGMNFTDLGVEERRLFGIRSEHGYLNNHRSAGEDNASNRAHGGLARDSPPLSNPARQQASPNPLQSAAHIGHLQYLIDLRPCPQNAASESIISRIWNTFLMDCRMQHLLLDDRELLFRIPLPDYVGGPVPENSRIPIAIISIWNNAVRNILDQQPIRLVRHPLYTQIALMFDNPPFMFRSRRSDPGELSTNGSDRRAGFQNRPPPRSVMNHPLQHPDSGMGTNGSMWRRQLREVTNNMFPENPNRYHHWTGFENTDMGSDSLHPNIFHPYDNENISNMANQNDVRNLPNLLHQYHQPPGGAVDLSEHRQLRLGTPITPPGAPRAAVHRRLRSTHAERAHPYRRPVRTPVAVSTAHQRLSRALHTPVEQAPMQIPSFQPNREDSNVLPCAAPLAAPSVSDARDQEITPPRQPGPYVHRWLSNVLYHYPTADLENNAGNPVGMPRQESQEPVGDRARRAQQSNLRPANGNRSPASRNANDNSHKSPDA